MGKPRTKRQLAADKAKRGSRYNEQAAIKRRAAVAKRAKANKSNDTAITVNTKRKNYMACKDELSGQFIPGHPYLGDSTGRPLGTRNAYTIDEFNQAIRNVERSKKVPLLEHLIKRAYKSDVVLIAIFKKQAMGLPDLKAIEMLVAGVPIDEEAAKAIQQRLRERFSSQHYNGNHVVPIDGED